MAKYEVEVRAIVTGSLTIEADSEEDAEREAENQFDLDMTEPDWCVVDTVEATAYEHDENMEG